MGNDIQKVASGTGVYKQSNFAIPVATLRKSIFLSFLDLIYSSLHIKSGTDNVRNDQYTSDFPSATHKSSKGPPQGYFQALGATKAVCFKASALFGSYLRYLICIFYGLPLPIKPTAGGSDSITQCDHCRTYFSPLSRAH